MLYLVAYDIADDRARLRVSETLEAFGTRVQESVFECRLDTADVEDLRVRLARALGDALLGQIRAYPVCRDCLRGSFGIGTPPPRVEASVIVIG